MKKSSRKTKRKGTVAVKVIAPKFENGGKPGDRIRVYQSTEEAFPLNASYTPSPSITLSEQSNRDNIDYPLPKTYEVNLRNFLYPNIVADPSRTGYNSLTQTISYDPNSDIENINNPWWYEHEMFHHLQNISGGMSTAGLVAQRPNPYVASDESLKAYYDRREADIERTIDAMIAQNPDLQFIPRDILRKGRPGLVGAEHLQYSDPTTIEGEARQYEQYIRQNNPSVFPEKEYANGGISFDFDDTLSTDLGLDLAKSIPSSDKYIISARPKVTPDMIKRAQQAGIPKNRIFAMGSDEAKVAKIQELGINRHIDNKQSVIDRLGFKGQLFANGGMYNSYQNLFANGGNPDEPPGRFFNWIKNLGKPKNELKGYTAGPIFDITTELGFKRQQLLNQSLGRPEIQADPWDQQRWLMEQNMADEEAGLYEAPTLPQEKVEPMPVYNAVEQLDFGPEFSQETKTELKSLYDQKLWQEKLNQRAIDFKKKNKFDKLDPLISLPLTDYEERLKADSKYENELKKQGYFINKNQTTGTVELFPANEIYTRIWNSGLRTNDIINKLGVGTKENVENYFGDFMGQADQYHEYQTKKAVLDLMGKGYSLDNAVNYLANVKKLGTKEDLYNSYGKDFKEIEDYAKAYIAYSDDYEKPYEKDQTIELIDRWTDNDIITLARDREFIDSHSANIDIVSPNATGRLEWGAQILQALRSGKWGWKPKSNELVKLASDDVYKDLIAKPTALDKAFINNLEDYRTLEPQDYNRKYSPTIAQDEEDWKKGKVAVQISETDEWRPNKMYVGPDGDNDAWGGQYYKYQFEVPAGRDPITGEQLTRLVTADEMAGQTVYMTQ
jgi:hypothetical protein